MSIVLTRYATAPPPRLL